MRRAKIYSLLITLLIGSVTMVIYLYRNGVIQVVNPPRSQYPVRGVVVSAGHGEIDWNVIRSQDMAFAYIKATDGDSIADSMFAENYSRIRRSGMRVGVYHCFRFDAGGLAQAEYFIAAVIGEEREPPDEYTIGYNEHGEYIEYVEKDPMLPPAVYIELYGDYANNPPGRDGVCEQLNAFILRVTEEFGAAPVIYVTVEAYGMYIGGALADCGMWILDTAAPPRMRYGEPWVFWQYTEKGRLNGFRGFEKFIGLIAFNGTEQEFFEYSNVIFPMGKEAEQE